jgi:hypothetical protein
VSSIIAYYTSSVPFVAVNGIFAIPIFPTNNISHFDRFHLSFATVDTGSKQVLVEEPNPA